MTGAPSLADIVEALWPHVSPNIERALRRGGEFHRLETVKERVLDGRAQLWPGRESAIVTEIETYPNARVLRYWLAGGKLEELVAMEPQVSAWGITEGCTVALIEGRRGWVKALPSYHESSVILSRRLRG